MPDWRDVPDWKFGDILMSDHPAQVGITKVMFLDWQFTAPHNPTESIFRGLVVGDGTEDIGTILTPYCGWWMPWNDGYFLFVGGPADGKMLPARGASIYRVPVAMSAPVAVSAATALSSSTFAVVDYERRGDRYYVKS